MIISELQLTHFKNHDLQHFQFSSQINCFVGNNGVGKTNVLDALHYVSMGKSFLGNRDIYSIKEGADSFTIFAKIDNENKEDTIAIHLPKDGKKIIKKNDKAYSRISDHIGYLPHVMISPYDSNLISDGSEARRKFLDAMISQTDKSYLHAVIQYQNTLKQRNALLKSFAKNRYFDNDTLEIYNDPLSKNAEEIHKKRAEFIQKLTPIVQSFYSVISGGNEEITIEYISDLQENSMTELLQDNLSKDRMLTYTSKGIHKDDLEFRMNTFPLKKFGSQGQQKSFLIALKLAQIQRIKELTNKKPIVLLDDIFDKLDDQRVSHLIELVNQQDFGQIFITDTHKERTESVVKRINEESKIFEL